MKFADYGIQPTKSAKLNSKILKSNYIDFIIPINYHYFSYFTILVNNILIYAIIFDNNQKFKGQKWILAKR